MERNYDHQRKRTEMDNHFYGFGDNLAIRRTIIAGLQAPAAGRILVDRNRQMSDGTHGCSRGVQERQRAIVPGSPGLPGRDILAKYVSRKTNKKAEKVTPFLIWQDWPLVLTLVAVFFTAMTSSIHPLTIVPAAWQDPIERPILNDSIRASIKQGRIELSLADAQVNKQIQKHIEIVSQHPFGDEWEKQQKDEK